MIKINKGQVLSFFDHNMKVFLAIIGLFSATLVLNLFPALIVLMVSILLSGTATALGVVLLYRGAKQGGEFNAYDFFRIPRPEERKSPEAGPTLREVRADE